MMFRLFFLLWITASASATSIAVIYHVCPVCGTKSVTTELASFSQFGEPARDLSDSPQLMYSQVDICPGDLYGSWAQLWDKINAEEKSKLAAFLKKPALHLSEAEKVAIGSHEKSFRDSPWFTLLWARTCDEFRNVEDRQKFQCVLQLHFTGKHMSRSRALEDWEKQLISLYRENAIVALNDAVMAPWPKPQEKLIFAYLRAELTRQAGRNAEALAMFQKIIATHKNSKPDDQWIWISRWTAEQSLRCEPTANDPAMLLAAIIPELPNPEHNPQLSTNPRWPRHFAAVDELAQHAANGGKAFSDALWKLLDRKTERLLALLETSDAKLTLLQNVDARWRDWFDEIAKQIKTDQLPSSIIEDSNKIRVINVLRRAVMNGMAMGKTWRNEVLLPVVRKAVVEGNIPSLVIPDDEPPLGLPLLGDGNNDSERKDSSLEKMSQQLYKLWDDQATPARTDIARIYIRILRNLRDAPYSADDFLPTIAESAEGRAAIQKELPGKWENTFWQAACSYAARMPDSTDAFLHHPFTAKANDAMIIKLLSQRSEPLLKNIALEKLNEAEWVSPAVIDYLVSLNLPETETALDAAAKRLRNRDIDPNNNGMFDSKTSTLRSMDEVRVKARLHALPIR